MSIGQKFNRLLVVDTDKNVNRRNETMWICLCDCGKTTRSFAYKIKSGHTKSCGCWQREVASHTGVTHRMSDTPVHLIWQGIRKRCNNPKSPNYKNYGAKGVTICAEWDDFSLFYEYVGDRPSKGHSIDRIDNSKGYEPGNVRWATRIEQNNNQTTNIIVECQGEKMTLAQACRLRGLPHEPMRVKVRAGKIFDFAETEYLEHIARRNARNDQKQKATENSG